MGSKEEWRDIKDFEGLYQVSNTGKIRSLSYNNTRIIANKKPVKNKKGKMEINLWKNNKAYPKTLARVVYETFSDKELRKNYMIQYLDGNSENCSFTNLYIKAKIRTTKSTKYIRNIANEIWKDVARL